MEVDDDFGDLYSDVLLPTIPADSSAKPPPSPVSNPNLSGGQIQVSSSAAAAGGAAGGATSAAAAAGPVDDDDWLLGGAVPAAVDPISNWADEDEGTEGNPSADGKPRDSVLSPGKAVQDVNKTVVTADSADPEEPQAVIPGLGTGTAAAAPPMPAESDDWDDSDSDDDLKIVLNDPEHGAMADMGYGDGDEEDVLAMGANGDQIGAMDQDWGEEGAAGAGGEGEGKEGDASKIGGVGGAGGAGPSRMGYGSGGGGHAFHQHHSIYKYVRPGAPMQGGPPGGVPGPQGQLRPPMPTGPYPGRGRGDWRPPGGRMMNGRGYGSWGNQMRPAGLDFSLPPQKTIFDFEIDNFEEKPWRHPGAEMTDYFNFEFNEDSWKDYCKRMNQLKIESTMQSKIRVYESGRSEPEYDPDLPPELAAAAKGHNVISTDNVPHNAKENGQADFSSQATSHGTRPALPTGRAIQVEGGYGERLPSIDTRPPRLRDSDSVIEIKLIDPIDDFSGEGANGPAEQTDQDSREDVDIDDSSEHHHSHRSRHRTRSPDHQEERMDRGDSWGRDSYSPSVGDTRREKPTQSVEDKPIATKEAAMKDPSVDERSDDHDERLAYTTDTENDEVNFDEPESPSKNQKENSLVETIRSDASPSRGNSRSDKEEEVVQVRHSKPPREGQRASRRNDSRAIEMERGRIANPNNMRWREGNEMYYNPYMNGRERDFVPPPHAFRGRSYERFREDGVMHARRFREEEMRADPRGGKRIPRNFDREEADPRLRKRVEEAEWRGARKRDREEGFDAHMKRRKEEDAPRRGKVDREDVTERKRERDEANHRARDKVVAEDHYRSKHREEGSRHRERDERQRSKQEETRVAIRTNKSGKEEPKLDDRDRKMRDKMINGSGIEKGLARQERSSHDDMNRSLGVPEKEKHKDSTRRSRGLETGMESRTKRRRDDHREGRQNDKLDVKGTINEQESSKKSLQRSEALPQPHHDHYGNPPDDTEEHNSDYDGTNDDSRRGRSKMERWASHKERDYSAISTSLRAPEAAAPSEPNLNPSSSNPKKATGDEATGPASSDNRHLDTVERLKRRSERFKLPMPGEKEVGPVRQAENEMTTHETEVKSERPPRKRRWTGN